MRLNNDRSRPPTEGSPGKASPQHQYSGWDSAGENTGFGEEDAGEEAMNSFHLSARSGECSTREALRLYKCRTVLVQAV
jgi:hypothetical protein